MKTIWAYSVSAAVYPTRLLLTGLFNTADIQIIARYRCLKYLQVMWSGILLTHDMEHVILLASRGYISVWTNNDLKCIDPKDIDFLSRILHQVMDLTLENTDGATQLKTTIAYATPYHLKRRQPTSLSTEVHYSSRPSQSVGRHELKFSISLLLEVP